MRIWYRCQRDTCFGPPVIHAKIQFQISVSFIPRIWNFGGKSLFFMSFLPVSDCHAKFRPVSNELSREIPPSIELSGWNSSQYLFVTRNSSQYRIVTRNSSQYRIDTRNSSQYRIVTRNSAQYRIVTRIHPSIELPSEDIIQIEDTVENRLCDNSILG